jgi:hypothetical protein
MIKLSICIPTVVGREKQFSTLKQFIENQCLPYKDEIEIVSIKDNKEISIGEKRKQMYDLCKGLYAWQIDDDDMIAINAIDLIMNVVDKGKDCITFQELCIFEDREEKSNFSLRYKEWRDNFDGFNHVRTPFCKTPIKTEICQKVGVKDMRYGEDHQFAKDIYSHLKSEAYINKIIYIYRYKFEESNKKYGIK